MNLGAVEKRESNQRRLEKLEISIFILRDKDERLELARCRDSPWLEDAMAQRPVALRKADAARGAHARLSRRSTMRAIARVVDDGPRAVAQRVVDGGDAGAGVVGLRASPEEVFHHCKSFILI